MNKIIVTNNIINSDGVNVKVDGNNIYFFENGDYQIEYEDCSLVNINIIIEENRMIKLFEYSDNGYMKVKNKYLIKGQGNLILFKFYNNDSVNEDIVFDLVGEYAKIDYHFSNIGIGNEKYRLLINHKASHTVSNITNKSIAISGGIDFTIDSVLPKESKYCVLNQDTKIINLGDNHSVIRPNMYIDLDEVEARHGSVIGKFSDDELFYLMSRGISYEEAIKLLVKGYIFSNLILDMDKRSKIFNIINKYWR